MCAGEPDQINLSADTYEIVKDFFECEYRGELNVKNKGNMEIWECTFSRKFTRT